MGKCFFTKCKSVLVNKFKPDSSYLVFTQAIFILFYFLECKLLLFIYQHLA